MSVSLPIACAIDQYYILPLAVLLESLKRSLRPDVRPVVFLIHNGIPPRAVDALSAIVEIRPVRPTADQLAASPRDDHFPPEASFPLLLAEVLPHLDRVLFLDADLLVLDDLWTLWETSLEHKTLAATVDAAVPFCSSPRGIKGWPELGIPRDAPYFNGGVLLIDLERWRARNVGARVRRYFDGVCQQVDFLHQEALNAALWDDWQPLHPRWNVLASRAGRLFGGLPGDAWKKPGIVHFAGRMKPWRAPVGGPFDAPYRHIMQSVIPTIAPEPTTWRDHCNSLYDRYFRAACYPLERLLWRQRLI